ncbi:MAG: isocitrate lyase/PEP mutase family protein [Nitrososphaeraceae archaeon]|jgi:carboxyvinyl-carboxyphosphonate phosphorylmutase|nr:isocitrate lyase/PEP mutase family protein [Nitrososphaeraceae archaeon]MDW3610690.1 isocitrate lyase/PEP mutase family protein [Nitrososphaeraceae archaeon]MDW3625469.1 isocitrate lyase/PEP mutase family protein [Nitrososphaeraceae archaeon]MDW3630630.1 isocitrate lyase/PEP mutase family protein [Nitrososphaeraceae archaeon]
MHNKRKISIRERLADANDIIILPGVYDALTAKIAEDVGFETAFQTGYGTSASLLGMPDFGFLNAGETLENAKRIINSVNIPILVDIDTGYGNPLNVWKIVKDLERIGAKGIFLEDQVWPKRCGHMTGKTVISKEEYILKLHAAIDAREDNEFIIVARTDSLAQFGIEEAIERGKEYKRIGADVIFIEAPKTIDQMELIAKEIKAPLLANMIEEGITPNLTADQLRKMGFKMVVFPLSALYSATFAIKQTLQTLKKTGTTKELKNKMITFQEFNDLVNLSAYSKLEKKYSS